MCLSLSSSANSNKTAFQFRSVPGDKKPPSTLYLDQIDTTRHTRRVSGFACIQMTHELNRIQYSRIVIIDHCDWRAISKYCLSWCTHRWLTISHDSRGPRNSIAVFRTSSAIGLGSRPNWRDMASGTGWWLLVKPKVFSFHSFVSLETATTTSSRNVHTRIHSLCIGSSIKFTSGRFFECICNS